MIIAMLPTSLLIIFGYVEFRHSRFTTGKLLFMRRVTLSHVLLESQSSFVYFATEENSYLKKPLPRQL